MKPPVSGTPATSQAVRCPLCEFVGVAAMPRRRGPRVMRCERCGVRFERAVDAIGPQSEQPMINGLARTEFGEPIESLASLAHERATSEALFQLIERYRQPGRLISMGTHGTGMRVARARGWDATGYAVETVAADPFRAPAGVPPLEGHPASPALRDATYDCVLIDRVLVDLADPGHYLRLARRILRPAGILMLTVPNAASVGARVGRRIGYAGLAGRPSFDAVGHRFEFTPSSLRTILARFYGFEVALIEGDSRSKGGSLAGRLMSRVHRRFPAISGRLRVVAVKRR